MCTNNQQPSTCACPSQPWRAANTVLADGHTASNAPDLFRPPKLSGAGPGQYWGGGPPGKTLGCCQLFACADSITRCQHTLTRRGDWINCPSQRSLHNAPIFRLLLKVAVDGTHQCDFLNVCGALAPKGLCQSKIHLAQEIFK